MSIDFCELTLYHGSTLKIDHIDLTKSRRNLDFGRGFYTTISYKQACRWSEIKYDRAKNSSLLQVAQKAASEVVSKVVSKYSFNDTAGLMIKEFPTADQEWLEFVVNNRGGTFTGNNYDIVIGPIANDSTLLVINTFMNGLYGVGEDAVRMAISLLRPETLEKQYAFCTKEAISGLTFKGCDYL